MARGRCNCGNTSNRIGGMSRIDDALRLAGGQAHAVAVPERDVALVSPFVSPWSGTDHAAPHVTSADGLTRRVDAHRSEPAVSRLRVVRPSAVEVFAEDWRPLLAVGELAQPTVSQQFRRLAASLIQAQRARPI